MNFVREIVESNAVVTIDKLTNDLPKLLEDSINLKSKTLHQLESVYLKFLSCTRPFDFLQSTNQLLEKAQQLEANIDEVIKVQVTDTHSQIKQFRQQLEQVNAILQVSYEYKEIYENLNALAHNIETEQCLNAAKLFKHFEEFDPTQENYALSSKLNAQAMQMGRKLNSKIERILDDYVKYSKSQQNDIIKHSIEIGAKDDKTEQAFRACFFLGCENNNYIQKWKVIILDMASLIVNASPVNVIDGCITIDMKKTHKESYNTVFENLAIFIKYLKNSLDLTLDETTSLLDLLRVELQDDLTGLIIKDCLEGTVPDSEVELEAYSEVDKHTNLLENTLKEAHFVDNSCTALSGYAAEVKVHFVDKKAKKYSEIAVDLMRQDLHTVVTVGIPFNPNDLSLTGFPECTISKSTVDLLALAQNLVQKEITCSGGSSGYYLETARSILAKYNTTIENHHQRLLQTVPRQRAIFYNNCKYIAHELKTTEWVNLIEQLPPVFVEHAGFTQVAFHLSEYARTMLEKLTADEVEKITKRIDESGIHLACDKLDEKVAQEVRQCLRQQELIKTMWHKVLNYHDYNRTIGTLLDALSRSVTDNIKKISDIPLDVCEQLVDVLKLIVTRGPKLLTDPKEIHMYVTQWGKLNELMYVLNSGLEAIRERWADGKGPLALHFTPHELRALVRALFQNSDQRAALLARI